MRSDINRLPSHVILWGGTGQAKVVRPIIEHYGSHVVAVFDDTPDLVPPFADVPLHTGWAGFQKWIRDQDRDDIGFCVAIRNPQGRACLMLHEDLYVAGSQP